MDYVSFVLQPGAAATGDCSVPTVTWISDTPAGSACDYTISRVYQATTETGLTATCTQQIHVKDDQKPFWMATPVNHQEYCVENIQLASWNLLNEPGTDISPVRPDYHVLTAAEKNAYTMDPVSYYNDNCTTPVNLILHWSIKSLSTGNYIADMNGNVLQDITDALTNHNIKLDGTAGAVVQYELKYWLEDACGNVSDQKPTVTITIKPRPTIIKMNEL
jgi:hypothetical protein